MRAAVFDTHGPAEVLHVVDLPAPHPGPGQVRVRVHAGGIQPFDTLVRRGSLHVPISFPQQLGNEFSGVIDQLGAGVTTWSTGSEVLGWAPMTALADYTVTDADALVTKPANMPWEHAGALGASGQTAATALRDLRIGPGDTVLIHAAAGGAGTAAVQLARAWGAHVIGTASEPNHGYLANLGATPVAYGPGLIGRVRAAAADGVHAALDAVGGQTLRDSLPLVRDKNRIGTLVDHEQAEQLGVRGIRARRSTEQLNELVELHQQGMLRVEIRATYPLDAIADAHRAVETGHGTGKVVVTVDTVHPTHRSTSS